MDAISKRLLISWTDVLEFISKTQSVKDEFSIGTLIAWPFNLPLSSGYIKDIALAEPVVVGIKLFKADLALLRLSFGRSINVWVFVILWIVDIEPCFIPIFSCKTLIIGAKQLVVQLAAVIILCLEVE